MVVASFLSAVLGCFKVPGVRALEVGLAQLATLVGRSAAVAEIEVNGVTAIARAQKTASLFMFEFLLPLDLFASVHFIPTRSFQVAC